MRKADRSPVRIDILIAQAILTLSITAIMAAVITASG
jgi:hypothetical protein